MNARNRITSITINAIVPSLATAYGKNGFPSLFSVEYSRRYASFCAWFISTPRSYLRLDALGLEDRIIRGGLDPRRRGGAELGHEIQVRADQRDDRARDQQ